MKSAKTGFTISWRVERGITWPIAMLRPVARRLGAGVGLVVVAPGGFDHPRAGGLADLGIAVQRPADGGLATVQVLWPSSLRFMACPAIQSAFNVRLEPIDRICPASKQQMKPMSAKYCAGKTYENQGRHEISIDRASSFSDRSGSPKRFGKFHGSAAGTSRAGSRGSFGRKSHEIHSCMPARPRLRFWPARPMPPAT